MVRQRVLAAVLVMAGMAQVAWAAGSAAWIWGDEEAAAPKNRFTYFRKVVALDVIPENAVLRMAADSNARLWINGQVVRRKVARYHEPAITAEVIDARPYLRAGKNVVVALHHNWGGITTFQRTGNRHAGLWIASDWVVSDASWRWVTAPEFAAHEKQVVGVIGDPRIRYPQIVDGRRTIDGDMHDPAFDDSGWANVHAVTDGPWPARPSDVETPGQREHAVTPGGVVAAGTARHDKPVTTQPVPSDPYAMAEQIKAARCEPGDAIDAAGLATGKPVTVSGKAGEVKYLTVDFHRPVHGYPYLELADAPAGAWIDLGYCELAYAQYDGAAHVRADGWINPSGVVGPGYADRYITRGGRQAIELPDERTARWLTLHVHFPADGQVTIDSAGIVKSQYPIRRIGSFACGDKRIEQIVELCLTHAEVTMSDTYVDTPGREDGQWIEDARPRAVLTDRWFGDDRLRKLMIRTLAESQGEHGQLHPFAPSNYPAYPAPYDWSVQWVAMLHDQYMWSGDIEEVRPWFQVLHKYWANVLSHVGEEGVWYTPRVLADIRMDTGAGKDESSGMVTPWIIERLRWSAQLAEVLGEKKIAADWAATAEKMSAAFRKYHLVAAEKKEEGGQDARPPSGGAGAPIDARSPGGGVSPLSDAVSPPSDGVGTRIDARPPLHVADRYAPKDAKRDRGYSQAGQTVAIMCGLLTRDEAIADLNYAFPAPAGAPPKDVKRWNNPTYGYRALRAMSDCGLAERAVAHLIERYSPYLPNNPRNPVPLALQGPYGGPLPEYWVSREDLGLKPGEKNHAQPADETGSHGWGAVPLLWLHDSLLGVRIVEPGGGRLRIAPQSGGLPYVAGNTVTPKGAVWVYYDPQQWRVEIDLPAGVTADVVLPDAFAGKAVRVEGGSGAVRTGSDGVFAISGPGRSVFSVRP